MNLDFSTIKTAVLWILVVLAVLAVVLAVVIKKVVGKIITLVVAAAVIFFGWQQRGHVLDYGEAKAGQAGTEYCAHSPKFFGVTVTLPGC